MMLPSVWTEPFGSQEFDRIRLDAARRFRCHQLPSSKAEWLLLRKKLRRDLAEKINLRECHDLPLDLHVTKTIDRGSYTIHNLYFQTLPGVYATGNLYVPAGQGPFPAVYHPHGHWEQGRLAAKIQIMGHLLAQCGYVVLTMDVFGAGERCLEHGRYEDHGGEVGGRTLSLGEPLLGILLSENMRALDLLQSLPYVDGEHLGVTGGSGGGNQTMYLAAFDERVKAAAPVVSAGTYQSYVCNSNCVCELIPDGLDICEESALFAMAAPRALLLCNAMKDSNKAFHVQEMLRSKTEASKVFAALGVPERLSSIAFNAEHSYPDEIRSAVKGFFDYYLKGVGACLPSPIPSVQTLPEAEMMVFAPGQRPPAVCSTDEYVARRALELKEFEGGSVSNLKNILRVHSGKLRCVHPLFTEGGWEKMALELENGRLLPVLFRRGNAKICRMLGSSVNKQALEDAGLVEKASVDGASILVFEHFGTGENGILANNPYNWQAEHQSLLARGLMWMGQRLMGLWTEDYLAMMQLARQLCPDASMELIGHKDSGIAAIYAALLSSLRARVVTEDCISSLVERGHTMATCIPGILKWGDLDYARNKVESKK